MDFANYLCLKSATSTDDVQYNHLDLIFEASLEPKIFFKVTLTNDFPSEQVPAYVENIAFGRDDWNFTDEKMYYTTPSNQRPFMLVDFFTTISNGFSSIKFVKDRDTDLSNL